MGGRKLDRLREEFAATVAREAEIKASLEEYSLLTPITAKEDSEQAILTQKMAHLLDYSNNGTVDSLRRQTLQVGSAIASANDVAEKMTKDVRKLGRVQERLKACVERSDGMMRIRQGMQRLKSAMADKNYKDAADCLKELRNIEAMRIPLDVSDSLRMNNAETDIRYAIECQLDVALRNRDDQAALRVGTIFEPMHFAEEGLTIVLKHLRDQLDLQLSAIQGAQNAVWSVQELTAKLIQVFNAVAEVIQRYEPLVVQSFQSVQGPERMLGAAYELGTPAAVYILTAYTKQRGLSDLLAKAKVAAKPVAQSTNNPPPSPTKQQASAQVKEDLDLNPYLNEVIMVIQHSQTFERFVRSRQATYRTQSPPSSPKRTPTSPAHLPPHNASKLNMSVQDIAGYYCSLEEYCLTGATRKALMLEEMRSVVMNDQLIPVSSVVDEIFYVARNSGARAIATGHIDSACGVLNMLATHLQSTLGDHFRPRVNLVQKEGQASALSMLTTLNPKQLRDQVQQLQATLGKKVPAATPPTSNPKSAPPPTMTLAPPVTLNSLDAIVQYCGQLRETFEADINAAFPDQLARMSSSLIGIEDASSEFQALLLTCHDMLCQTFQPKVAATATPLFKKLTYELSEAMFTANEANDPFAFALVQMIKTLVAPYETHLSKPNYVQLMESLGDAVVDLVDSMIATKSFNVLGAMQLEKDVRVLSAFFAEKCDHSARHLASFALLRQIVSVLSVDAPEDVLDVFGRPSKGGIEWKLSKQRVVELLHSRVEFSTAAVSAVKL